VGVGMGVGLGVGVGFGFGAAAAARSLPCWFVAAVVVPTMKAAIRTMLRAAATAERGARERNTNCLLGTSPAEIARYRRDQNRVDGPDL
jgi:hypothetical protein